LAELFEFVWLPTFERASRKLLSEDDRRSIEVTLCEDPEAGDLMQRTGGFRKLRVPLGGRGKSGGARVIYLADPSRNRLFMALAYAKGTKSTLTRREEDELRRLARLLLQDLA
jgi:hypothetical protein